MHEIELVKGECSHPPLHDDVSDDYFFVFYDSDIYDTNLYHESPIIPKCDEKTIQAIGDLVGGPLDSRKTISQFNNAL